MTKIVAISGSSRPDSSNKKLIRSIVSMYPGIQWEIWPIEELPLFYVVDSTSSNPEKVKTWKSAVAACDGMLIVTPEYIHNLPAVIKNALEWLTSEGELMNKRVLPITFTPHAPRGEKTMQSLLWSLQALDASVVSQMAVYQNEVSFNEEDALEESASSEMIEEAIKLLK